MSFKVFKPSIVEDLFLPIAIHVFCRSRFVRAYRLQSQGFIKSVYYEDIEILASEKQMAKGYISADGLPLNKVKYSGSQIKTKIPKFVASHLNAQHSH